MTRISIAAALGAALACAAVAGAQAEDFEAPIDLPTGAVIHLDIVKNGEEERDGKTTKAALSFRYRQAVTSTDEGYTIDQTLVESKLPPEARDIAGALAAASKIVFDADIDLSPIRIRNQAALVDGVIKGLVDSAPPGTPKAELDAAMVQVKQVYEAMSPEAGAASFLKEQGLLAAPQLMALDLGKPIGGDIPVANPFGGEGSILRKQSYELKSIDRSAGRAVIEFRDSIDQDSVKALIGPMMDRLAPDAPRPTEAELAAFKIEQTTACRYEMDLKTGLTAKAECTITRSAMDAGGKPNRRVEHMEITQRLELPK